MFHMEQPLNIFKGGLIKKDPRDKENSQKNSYNSGKKDGEAYAKGYSAGLTG
jgi:hypothetical protein